MRPEDIKRVCRNAVKPGQKLRFHCSQCGDCCRNREDIILTPYDVILDDDDDMDGHMEHLVQTDFDSGLTEEKADECIRILGKR